VSTRSRRLLRMVHPFDALLVLVVAIGIIPAGVPWTSLVWALLLIGITYLLRHRSRERARKLANAAGEPTDYDRL
jgi:hypothetical protein